MSLGFPNRTITFYGNAPSLDASSISQTFNITVGCTDYLNDTPRFMTDVFVIVVAPGKGNTLVLKGIGATVGTQIFIRPMTHHRRRECQAMHRRREWQARFLLLGGNARIKAVALPLGEVATDATPQVGSLSHTFSQAEM